MKMSKGKVSLIEFTEYSLYFKNMSITTHKHRCIIYTHVNIKITNKKNV